MSAFSSNKAVLVALHGSRVFDPAVIPLEEEGDYLLVNGLSWQTGFREQRRIANWKGQPLYRRDADPFLNFTLRAAVMGWGGMADAHPGPLTREALVFANGGRVPHKFMREAGGEAVGLFYYEGASTEHAGGDVPEITINLSLDFTGLDVFNHAGTETSEGYLQVVRTPETASVTYVDLPAEATPVVVSVAARTGVTQVLFQSAVAETLFTLYPLNGVAEVLGGGYSDGWTELEEDGGNAQISIASCPAVATWGALEVTAVLSGVKAGNGEDVAEWLLTAEVEVPPFQYFRIPAGALKVKLEWPWDGAEPDDKPARLALKELLGQANTEPQTEQILITAWDGDPAVAGVELTSWNVGRDAVTWECDAAGVRNLVELTSGESAPGGGWAVEYVTAELPLLPGWLMKLAVAKTVAAGDPVVLAAGDLDLVF